MRVPPWKSLGLCLRVTNKGESGFGEANDREQSGNRLFTIIRASYRQLISGCRRVRYPLTTDALSLSHDVTSLLPRKEFSACPPLAEFGAVSTCDQ